MNSIWLGLLITELRNIASTSYPCNVVMSVNNVVRIRDNIISIANECSSEEPQISRLLLRAKDILFSNNQLGQGMVNPVVLGEIIFGLDYLAARQDTKTKLPVPEEKLWSYIHPLIKNVSKKLYEDGHYANAAEDAFIELNDRVKHLYAIIKPGEKIPDGDTAMTTVFSTNNPLVEFCNRSTETGYNKQKGYMQMLAGAMSALRNPKAHSNAEILSADEGYRRLATASMLMYAIDEAVEYSGITE